MKLKLILIVLICMMGWLTVEADEIKPPYLYYYSRMLGGIIIERADGTDSHHIGADIIPAGMTGIGGPGWSPSGKFFAGYGVVYTTYHRQTRGAFVMTANGERILNRLGLGNAYHMEWASTGEDILLIVGGGQTCGINAFYWLYDVNEDKILAEFGASNSEACGWWHTLTWDVANEQVQFYIGGPLIERGYFRVTMKFDGTTLREPISREEYPDIRRNGFDLIAHDYLWVGYDVSPSERYLTERGKLTDTETGRTIDLPRHTQGIVCADYIWTEDEQHIIVVRGTLRAGGGCDEAVLGVTNSNGELWRELGYCSWDRPPCIGWLPDHIDVGTLIGGASIPIQIDPVQIDYESRPIEATPSWAISFRITCNGDRDRTLSIIHNDTEEIHFTLAGYLCPYNRQTYYDPTYGYPIVALRNQTSGLLSTYITSERHVTIWQARDDNVYYPLYRLNTDGYLLEFSADGQYLWARNVRAWKVFAMSDIFDRLEQSNN